MKKRVNIDEINMAKEADLISFLEGKGEQFLKQGKYYRHTDHDSLVIKGNMYAWNSRNEKGYGAINFAMMYYHMSFPEAVQDINNGKYLVKDHSQIQEKAKPFSYPKNIESANTQDIKRYLIKERCIDERLVNWLIKKDYIAQDKRNNIVFKWKDANNNIIGAELHGTKTNKEGKTFKHVMPNDKPLNGFTIDIGKPTSIHYFEGNIDMLSFWSIRREKLNNTRLISMNGLKHNTIAQTIKDATNEGLNINHVTLAVDNDKGGNEFINKVKPLFKEEALRVDIPKANEYDWNDVIKHHRIKKKGPSVTITRKEVEKTNYEYSR